ncbi:ATP-binding cassette domain-containing protein [Nocardia asteroides]|uniref:ABC transporter ATP-binding protein/permease n=1 Tax=Nocardia asteroides TaxID=1824 RepID=UPI001E466414|nr:ATP-binding cassette domain-containing protein [Nocardia asteroides]UGT57724.1 ATP-binding cassette domain-containing protein [Nocardia asteroides]
MAGWWRWSVGAGVALVILLAVVGPLLAPYSAEHAVGMPFAGPGGGAVLGTDRLGRDVLSHLLTGGFQLLVVSAVIAVAVTVLSALLGAVAAVRPRAATVIALGGDLLILLPAVLGILLVLTAWPQGGVFALIAVSLLFGVPYCARIFASAAAGIAATGYVEAAIASGESLTHLVFREILPNLRSVFTTQLGLRFVVAVYLVSTVAFLGVSALDDDNWANMVRDNASGLLLNPWATLAPSAAIAIVAVGVNLVVTGGPARTSPGKANIPAPADEVVSGREPESSAVDTVLVVVEDLTVVAHSGAVLLAPLSFRLKPGTVTALTGASGAGKSTAMRALLGHVPPGVMRKGTVRVAGHDVFALDPVALRTFRRSTIAYVGQDPGSELNPLLRVRTLLVEAAPTASDADRLAALETVGLDATHLRRRCGRLSGGQQRRVALARALLRRPDVVVLDEPLAGLHGALRTEIAHLIAGLATDGSTAVLLSGHDTKTIHAIADTVLEVHPPGGLPNRDHRVATPVLKVSPSDGLPDRPQRLVSAEPRPAETERSVVEPMDSPGPVRSAVNGNAAAHTEGDAATEDDAVELSQSAAASADSPESASGAPSTAGGRSSAEPPPGGSATIDSGPTALQRTTAHDRPEHGVAERSTGSADADDEGIEASGTVDLPDPPTALRAQAIRASANGENLLHDIGFTIGAGEALAVVGPSGAGKTTLARVIAGLHRTATGTLELRGTPIRVGRRRRIRAGANGIQLVTQNPLGALNPRRTVEQTLARPLRRIAGVPKAELGARVESLLTAVDLPADIATRHPAELSGGQRQRVALARALAADPAVLICDEITTALDTATAAAIMALLDDLRATRGTAVVLISHDMALVTTHCTGLLVLDHGRIVESGAPTTVLATPSHQATADLLG